MVTFVRSFVVAWDAGTRTCVSFHRDSATLGIGVRLPLAHVRCPARLPIFPATCFSCACPHLPSTALLWGFCLGMRVVLHPSLRCPGSATSRVGGSGINSTQLNSTCQLQKSWLFEKSALHSKSIVHYDIDNDDFVVSQRSCPLSVNRPEINLLQWPNSGSMAAAAAVTVQYQWPWLQLRLQLLYSLV